MEAQDAEVKKLLEKKDLDLEEMKKRLKNQERERQSELLKLQMEVNYSVSGVFFFNKKKLKRLFNAFLH